MKTTCQVWFRMLVLTWPFAFSTNLAALELESSLYGKINISHNSLDPGDDDWISNASRIGIEGSYSIGTGLDVVYQFEQAVDYAHGGKEIDTVFDMRNSFIGIKGTFGQLVFGAHDTPFKRSQGKVDVFNDNRGDIKVLLVGEARPTDSWLYHSPTFADKVQVSAMYVPSDGNFESSRSVAITYTGDALTLAFALDDDLRKNDRAVSRTRAYDSQRIAGAYKSGDLTLGAIYQISKRQQVAGADRETGFALSGAYKVGGFTIKGQYGESDIAAPGRDVLALGTDYMLTDNAKCYLYYMSREDGGGDTDSFEIGFEVKF